MNLLLTLLPLLPSILSAIGTTVGQSAAASTPIQTSQAQSMQTILQMDSAFIKMAQQLLNELQTLGEVNFGAALTVDGIAGPRTTTALQAVVAKYMPGA